MRPNLIFAKSMKMPFYIKVTFSKVEKKGEGDYIKASVKQTSHIKSIF